MTDGGYSARADIAAIDAHMRHSAASAFDLVNDFAVLPGTRGPLGIAGDACSHRQTIAYSDPTISKSLGLIARHPALLQRCRTLALTPKRTSVRFVEPFGQP
ncbi:MULTISPECIES: hypothetical protein [Bradyrhizobium]|uniref:hypothetical protein n=1 Tax=Bradyrhizobium pachyrhizi TaxID=280333 RepID=UPI002AA5864E